MLCQQCRNKQPCEEGDKLRDAVRRWSAAERVSPNYPGKYQEAIARYKDHRGDNAGPKSGAES
jgi:hypothetical protein